MDLSTAITYARRFRNFILLEHHTDQWVVFQYSEVSLRYSSEHEIIFIFNAKTEEFYREECNRLLFRFNDRIRVLMNTEIIADGEMVQAILSRKRDAYLSAPYIMHSSDYYSGLDLMKYIEKQTQDAEKVHELVNPVVY